MLCKKNYTNIVVFDDTYYIQIFKKQIKINVKLF